MEAVTQAGAGADAYRQLAEVYNQLTALALEGADAASVTQMLVERMGQAVAVLDASLQPIAIAVPPTTPWPPPAGWPEIDSRLPRILPSLGETRRAVRLPEAGPGLPPLVAAPITVGGETVAYVLTFRPSQPLPTADFDLLVTEHATTVFAVLLSRERVLADVDGKVREDLFDALLVGRIRTSEERERWAEHLGYRQKVVHRCLIVAPEGIDAVTDEPGGAGPTAAALQRAVQHATAQLVASRAPSAVVATRGRNVVVLAERDGRGATLGARQLAEELAQHLGARYGNLTVTVGVGGDCSQADEISRSYEQALRTLRAARSLGRHGRAVTFEDLGVFRLLLQVPDIEELTDFAHDVFGELLRYDSTRRSGLLRTLASYLHSNGSLNRAGKELHLHPNSVSYRLSRVEELSGLQLEDYDQRLLAHVALAILEGLEPRLLEKPK